MFGKAALPVAVGLLGLASAQTGNLQDLQTVLAHSPNLTTYYGLIQQYPAILRNISSYAGVTIIAPENSAFDRSQGWDMTNETLVTNILSYHILQGVVPNGNVALGVPSFAPTLLKDQSYTNVTGGQRVGINKQLGNVVVYTSGLGSRSTLISGDTQFSGGLLQTVDSILVPPARIEPTMRDAYMDLQSFLGALYQTGLVSQYGDMSNVTIFAPNARAFQKVAGTLAGLSQADLRQVLSYHVVPQLLYSTSLMDNITAPTLANTTSGAPQTLRITSSGNNRYIDSAQLLQPDILVANGVVHIIDNVLNPNQPDAQAQPSIGTQPPAFPLTGATATGTAAPTPFTTALPCTTADCPATGSSTATSATATKTSSRINTATSAGMGVGSVPRCTGLAQAVGVVGLGVMGVAAVL